VQLVLKEYRVSKETLEQTVLQELVDKLALLGLLVLKVFKETLARPVLLALKV
jgi:hypothetical protein